MFVKKISFLSFFALNLLNAREYRFSGDIASYSKFGFNHNPINETTGQYPTDNFYILYTTPSFSFKQNHWDFGDEESFSLNMDYIFIDKLSLGINFTYFDDTIKKGYQIYQTYLQNNIKEDRSYISTYIKHSF